MFSFIFFAHSNGHLVSAKTVVFFMFVCFMFLSVTLTGTPACLFFSLVKDFFFFLD